MKFEGDWPIVYHYLRLKEAPVSSLTPAAHEPKPSLTEEQQRARLQYAADAVTRAAQRTLAARRSVELAKRQLVENEEYVRQAEETWRQAEVFLLACAANPTERIAP